MKVVDKRREAADFEDLSPGDTFKLDDRVWMVCDAASEGNAVCLTSGSVRWVKDFQSVDVIRGAFVEGYDG